MLDIASQPHEDVLSLSASLEEDIESELEEFVLLARLGLTNEAHGFYEEVLHDHVDLFPVFAEVAAFYMDIDEPQRIRQLILDHETRVTTLHTPDQRSLIHVLKSLSSAIDPDDMQHKDSEALLKTRWKMFVEEGLVDGMSSYRVQMGETLAYFAAKFTNDFGIILSYTYRFAAWLLGENSFWELARIYTICGDRILPEIEINQAILDYLHNVDRSMLVLQMKISRIDSVDPTITLSNVKAKLAYLRTIIWQRQIKVAQPEPLDPSSLPVISNWQLSEYQLHPPEVLARTTRDLLRTVFECLPDISPQGRLYDILNQMEITDLASATSEIADTDSIDGIPTTTDDETPDFGTICDDSFTHIADNFSLAESYASITQSDLRESEHATEVQTQNSKAEQFIPAQSIFRPVALTGVLARFAEIPARGFHERGTFLATYPGIMQADLTEFYWEALYQIASEQKEFAQQCVSSMVIIRMCTDIADLPKLTKNLCSTLQDSASSESKDYNNMLVSVLADILEALGLLNKRDDRQTLGDYRTPNTYLRSEYLADRLNVLLDPSMYRDRDMVKFGIRSGIVRKELQYIPLRTVMTFRIAARRWKKRKWEDAWAGKRNISYYDRRISRIDEHSLYPPSYRTESIYSRRSVEHPPGYGSHYWTTSGRS